jgi:hypothetical protein
LTVCFSIAEYKDCVEMRDNGNYSGPVAPIYHRGKCTNDPADFEAIRADLQFYYGCNYELKVLLSAHFCPEIKIITKNFMLKIKFIAT